MTDATGRVREVPPVTDAVTGTRRPDFACAYQISLAPGDIRTSEQWARTVWEGAPAPRRWIMVAGWRLGLRLRLGPRRAPDHILGWPITDRSPEQTTCHLDSWFLSASNVFRVADGTFTWSTFVTYERPIARIVWPLALPVHRLLVQIALRQAV